MQKEYTTLKAIVDQLESCNYVCEGGSLSMSIAFIALKKLAKQEQKGDN